MLRFLLRLSKVVCLSAIIKLYRLTSTYHSLTFHPLHSLEIPFPPHPPPQESFLTTIFTNFPPTLASFSSNFPSPTALSTYKRTISIISGSITTNVDFVVVGSTTGRYRSRCIYPIRKGLVFIEISGVYIAWKYERWTYAFLLLLTKFCEVFAQYLLRLRKDLRHLHVFLVRHMKHKFQYFIVLLQFCVCLF